MIAFVFPAPVERTPNSEPSVCCSLASPLGSRHRTSCSETARPSPPPISPQTGVRSELWKVKPRPSLLGVPGKKHPQSEPWPWCSTPCWVRGVLQPRSFPRQLCCSPGDPEGGRAGAGGAWRRGHSSAQRPAAAAMTCAGRWPAAPQSRPSTPEGHSRAGTALVLSERSPVVVGPPRQESHDALIYRRTERCGVKARLLVICVCACLLPLVIYREVYLSPRRS